jgi:hypothetical protein
MTHLYAAHVARPAVRKLQRLLLKLGTTDIRTIVDGYVVWRGLAEWVPLVRASAGVQLVASVSEEEVARMEKETARVTGPAVGATVSVPCGGMNVVGRIDGIKEGKATIVTALFGRPTKVVVQCEEIKPVELPEAWR